MKLRAQLGWFGFAHSLVVAPLLAQPVAVPELAVRRVDARQIQVSWPVAARGYVLEQAKVLASSPVWQPVTQTPIKQSEVWSVTLDTSIGSGFFRLHAQATSVSASSPVNGETGVAVTRETIVHFSAPLATNAVVTTDNFFAGFGGRRVLSRVELSSDRMKATLFYLEPLPGSARVVVVFDGSGVLDEAGTPVDADGDGTPGGQAIIAFDTLNLTALAGTAVVGKVFASELAPGGDTGTNAVNKPLAGVTITVDGMEQTLRAVTDATGSFTLSPAPPGRFFVHIDGRTVTNLTANIHYPDKSYYPYVGKAWDAVAGVTNNLAGSTGTIYLPLIVQGTLQPVSLTNGTTISFPANVIANNPALAGVSITVPANSLFNDNGTRGGKVGIAPVPPDRLPGPLPPGVDMPIVVTIQTDGASNFENPIPVRFPNLPNPKTGLKLAPGAKSALLSFDHDTGRWEIEGSMTVTADGLFVESDPGVGVRQPGWHGTDPRCGAGGGGIDDDPPCKPGDFPGGSDETNCKILSATLQGRTGYCEQYRIACNLGCQDCLSSGDIAAYEACIQVCNAYFAYCATSKTCPWPPEYDPDGRDLDSLLPGDNRARLRLQRFGSSASDNRSLSGLATATAKRVLSTGLHYYAIENLARKEIEIRGTAGANGTALPEDVILAPQTAYRIWILEAKTLRVGSADFTSPTSGKRIELPVIFTWPDFSPDTDGDGLRDDGEMILGTDSARSDTDNDGMADSTEVRQGLNPADGLGVRTGIFQTVKTPGPALDVWAGNELVATAEGTSGVSIFNSFNGLNPAILAHVPTSGNAQRIVGDGNFLAVAASEAGLIVIDASMPAAARISHQLPLGTAQAITASLGVAYVGFGSGAVAAVDMATGFLLNHLLLPKAVWDLALEGDYLFALTDDKLFAISLADGEFKLAGSTTAPSVAFVGANRRLFVGGGIGYSVHPRGYNMFDLTDPAKPLLLAFGNTRLFGWKHIVPNGSGLGLAAVGVGLPDNEPRDVSLYDLSDPRTNNIFITTFPTPGVARTVTIYNGLAYVADDSAGLQVINYLPYDAKGVPPRITLTTSFSTNGVAEGKQAWVAAQATDDGQVRNVEFYVDGAKVSTDGAFPFNLHFATPRLTANQKTFRLRARAFDTGDNFTWTEEIVVPLLPDTTPPRVLQRSPLGGGKAMNSIFAYFDEAMDPATLTPAAFKLVSAGADGVFDTADDVPVIGGSVSYQANTQAAYLTFASPLPDGFYRAILTTAATDLAGNHLASDSAWHFHVADAVFWINPLDGVWSDQLNWSTGVVPGPNDNVVIDLAPGDVTVALGTGTTVIKSLLSNEQIVITLGTLQVSHGIQIGGNLTLDRTTILGGTITATGGAKVVCVGNPGSTLDGVTLNGDLDVTSFIARVFIRNGLKVSGNVFLDNGGVILFVGDQSLDTGSINFVGGYLSVADNTTLTLRPAVAVRGSSGQIVGNGTLINQGLISADAALGSLAIDTGRFTNLGTNECKNGASLIIRATTWNNAGTINATGTGALTLTDAWTNTGTINADGATVNLGGAFTLAQLGAFKRTGGTVNLTGLLNLNGDTLALDATTGSWVIAGGTILGGTVTTSGGAKLSTVGINGNTLNGVTLQGDFAVAGRVFIRNGLSITGNVLLDVGGNITFVGDQTFATGAIVFTSSVGYMVVDVGTTLTLGPAAVMRGQSGQVLGSGKLINQGLIAVDVARGTLTLNPGAMDNAGTLAATGTNATLRVTTKDFTNTGTLQEANGGKVVIVP